MELVNLLKEGDNFKLAVLITNEIENVRKEIEKDFWVKLRSKINSAIQNSIKQLTYRKIKYSFDAENIVFEKKKNDVNHGSYGIYYDVKKNFLNDSDLIFGVEVEWNLYMCFTLINNDGDAFDIDQFKDRNEIKELSELLKKINFVVRYSETNGPREKQLIGWKYLNNADTSISLFDVNQMKRISNCEELDSYTEKLKDIVVKTIRQIGNI